ncbi:MAG: hypothetical protein J6X80_09810 [Lachnospiraceae bacterium]|nr:hypothetical protein [Lachnospiraceae bacterium]
MDNNNQNYNNYYYGGTTGYEVVEKKKNVCGILSFVFGLVSLGIIIISCCGISLAVIPYIGWFIGIIMQFGNFLIIPLALAGLILGIIGAKKKDCPKGLAVAGIIICALVLLFYVIMVVLIVVTIILATLGVATTGIFAVIMQYLNQMNITY